MFFLFDQSRGRPVHLSSEPNWDCGPDVMLGRRRIKIATEISKRRQGGPRPSPVLRGGFCAFRALLRGFLPYRMSAAGEYFAPSKTGLSYQIGAAGEIFAL